MLGCVWAASMLVLHISLQSAVKHVDHCHMLWRAKMTCTCCCSQNEVIDAKYKGNRARFINHSCQPNCETQKWLIDGETCVCIFALRDILPGEELTYDYHLQCGGGQRVR